MKNGGGDPPPRPPQRLPLLRVSVVLNDLRDLLPSSLDTAATTDHCRDWLLSLVGRGVLIILPTDDTPEGAHDVALRWMCARWRWWRPCRRRGRGRRRRLRGEGGGGDTWGTGRRGDERGGGSAVWRKGCH